MRSDQGCAQFSENVPVLPELYVVPPEQFVGTQEHMQGFITAQWSHQECVPVSSRLPVDVTRAAHECHQGCMLALPKLHVGFTKAACG